MEISSRNLKRLWKVFTHPDVVPSLSIPCLNTVVLLGKSSSRIPALITHLGYLGLNGIGNLYLHYYVRYCRKAVQDAHVSLAHHNWIQVSYAVMRLGVQGSGALLTVGNTCAAIALAFNQTPVVRFLFNLMCPWGLASLIVQIFLEIIVYCTDPHLLTDLKLVNQAKVHQFFSASSPLAIWMRSRMDPETWRDLEAKARLLLEGHSRNPFSRYVQHRRLRQLFQTAVSNVTTQHQAARNMLLRNAIGYTAMAITRSYPFTLLEAGINWTISFYYLGEVTLKTYQEVVQRETIEEI